MKKPSIFANLVLKTSKFSIKSIKQFVLFTALMGLYSASAFAQAICLRDTSTHPQFYDFGAVGNDEVAINGLNQYGWTGSSNVTGSTIGGNTNFTNFHFAQAVQTMTRPVALNFDDNYVGIYLHYRIRSTNASTASQDSSILTIKYAGRPIVRYVNPAGLDTGMVGKKINYSYNFDGTTDIRESSFRIAAAGTEYVEPDIELAFLPNDFPMTGNIEIEYNGGTGSVSDDFQISEIYLRGCAPKFSGIVLLDENGMNDGAINGFGINNADGNQLRVGLFDTNGNILDSTDVNSDGTYNFAYFGAGDFTLRLLNLPATYINTGEILGTETTASDGNPNGITSVLTILANRDNPDSNINRINNNFGVQLNPALPVTFGNIMASFDGSQLIVNWNSIAEINNDHYEVEVSRDGVTFTSLGTVASKAENGNSDIAIDYNFTKSQSEASSALGWLALPIPFLLFAFAKRNRRTLALGVLVSVISLAGVSCNKSTDTLSDAEGKLYVRIAQVDKDGTRSYSKTIQIVRK